MGDTVANEVIKTHDDLVRAELDQAGAQEIKSLGDGFMALFSSASRAIETAIAIQREIEAHNESNPDQPMSVRMGLNSGDVSHSDGDAHGTAVHAASRIADKAQGGQILIAQIVNDLVGTTLDTKITDRGLFWLKGFPDRWRLYEVIWRANEGRPDRATKDIRAGSAAAFDFARPRAANPLVGRASEQKIIREQLAIVRASGLGAVVLEGEAGIGKTRMLEATAEMATEDDDGIWTLDVSADEELRGPFLLFRSLLTAPRTAVIAREAMASEQLDRAQNAIGGRSSIIEEGLSPQDQMMRVFDEVATAISALARERPLALLFDDLQWADEDSIQLIRYLVRTLASAPIFLAITIRPHSDSTSGGAGKLIADLDRMRVTRVCRLERFTKPQTQELLNNLLGAPVGEPTLNSLHARSEGVPFFIEEFARAYREAEALQLMDGIWTMTKLSGPAVPSSVQSLIERRLAQLADDCKDLLADAGVLGRRFRLDDLSKVLARLRNQDAMPAWQLGEELESAVGLGLIIEEPDNSAYDYSFTHDQIRASLLDGSSRQRQRAVHGAMAEILADVGDAESLPMLAHHALKAGVTDLAVTSGHRAAQTAMESSAPEEAIRLIDEALPAASEPSDRIDMLRVKDDALDFLDRGVDRMANLAEMAAIAGALASPVLDAEVSLRRASAARAIQDYDSAADLARKVVKVSHDSGDREMELAAWLELGQAVTRSPIGEGYWPLSEVDLDAAEEPFRNALEIAREIEDRSDEAAALRELAVVEGGRVRQRAQEAIEAGVTKIEFMMGGPAAFAKAKGLAEDSFRIYEELDDKRGSMSALISMAYSHVTDPTARGMAGRIEHVRTLQNSRQVTESQRATDDALMLYSIQSYAALNGQPDLALERGRQAFEGARAIGDRWLECLAAGRMAMTHVSIGDVDEAGAWIERAAEGARAVPTTATARRLEMWRGALASAGGDTRSMVAHYERAAELAGTKNLGGRCEAYAALASDSAQMAVFRPSDDLFEIARSAAEKTLELVRPLSGPLPWESVAHAALAVVEHAAGNTVEAADNARASLAIDETHFVDFVNVLWAAARTLIAQEEPEAPALEEQLTGGLHFINTLISEPEIKAKWFAMPAHRELADLVGFEPYDPSQDGSSDVVDLTEDEIGLLRALASGAESAEGNGNVSGLLERLGVASEAEAVEYAIKAGVTWQ